MDKQTGRFLAFAAFIAIIGLAINYFLLARFGFFRFGYPKYAIILVISILQSAFLIVSTLFSQKLSVDNYRNQKLGLAFVVFVFSNIAVPAVFDVAKNNIEPTKPAPNAEAFSIIYSEMETMATGILSASQGATRTLSFNVELIVIESNNHLKDSINNKLMLGLTSLDIADLFGKDAPLFTLSFTDADDGDSCLAKYDGCIAMTIKKDDNSLYICQMKGAILGAGKPIEKVNKMVPFVFDAPAGFKIPDFAGRKESIETARRYLEEKEVSDNDIVVELKRRFTNDYFGGQIIEQNRIGYVRRGEKIKFVVVGFNVNDFIESAGIRLKEDKLADVKEKLRNRAVKDIEVRRTVYEDVEDYSYGYLAGICAARGRKIVESIKGPNGGTLFYDTVTVYITDPAEIHLKRNVNIAPIRNVKKCQIERYAREDTAMILLGRGQSSCRIAKKKYTYRKVLACDRGRITVGLIAESNIY